MKSGREGWSGKIMKRLAANHYCAARRSCAGVYMIEMLLAIATSSVLAAALVANLADTERLATSGQNQIIAAAIAQELIDNTRNAMYDSLAPGTYNDFLLNRTGSGQSGGSLNPRPLLLDLVNQNYGVVNPFNPHGVLQPYTNLFQGTVSQKIIDNGSSGRLAHTKTVVVTVSWNEGGRTNEGGSTKSLTLSTLVAFNGIHNW